MNNMKIYSMVFAAIITTVSLSACAEGYYSYDESSDTSKTVQLAMADKPITKANTSLGEVFVNAKGMTLYTFAKDGKNKSNCNDGCTGSWPPVMASKDAAVWGAFTVIKRADGQYQWAWQDQPLYTWVGDRKPGDVTGHEVGNVWFAALTGK